MVVGSADIGLRPDTRVPSPPTIPITFEGVP